MVLIKARDDASATIDNVGSKFGGFARVAGAAALAGGTAIAAGLAVGIHSAGDLQQSVANISTIKPTINTTEVFNALNDMSTKVPQSAKDLGDGLYNIFSSIEVSQGGALQLLQTFAQGAVGASTDAQTFGTAALGVMNAYGLSVDQAQHISDVFFNTVNAGVVTGPELAASLGPVTQAAKSAGVSLDELGGFIVGVTKEGGPAAQNINNLSNLFQKFTTTEAQNQLHRLGIETTDANGKFLPMTGVLQQLKDKLGGMTDAARAAELQKIFPDAQARQGAQTILSQLDAVKSAIDTNKNATGSASDAYEKMSNTFNSQSTLLKNSFMRILTTIGAELLPAITPLVKMMAENLPQAFDKARQFVDQLIAAFKTGDFSKIGDTLLGGLRAIGDKLGPLIAEWGPKLGPFLLAMINPPLLLLNETVREKLADVLGKVITWAKEEGIPKLGAAIAEWTPVFLNWAGEAGKKLLGALGDFGHDIVTWVTGTAAPEIAGGLKDWAGAFTDWAGDALPPLMDKLGELLNAAVTWIATDGLTTIGGQLVEWGTAFVEWVGPAVGPLLGKLGDLAVRVFDWVLEQAPGLLGQLAVWAGQFIAWVAPLIPKLIVELVALHAAVIAWIVEKAPAILTQLADWGASFLGFVATHVLPKLAETLGTILTGIGTWITSEALPWALRELVQVGTAIIDGIKAGITAAASSLADAAINAAKGALDAVRDFLHIRSPSQRFADEIGVPIGMGIAAGILSTAGAVGAAAQTVSAVALSAAQLNWGGGGGGSAQMSEPPINISNSGVGGVPGLTQHNIKWGDSSFVQWSADTALMAVSSAFGSLGGVYPQGTPLWQVMGFQSEETFNRWLAAIKATRESGQFTGEGKGLFGSTLGDVQSLLDILSPNPAHHAAGGVFGRPTTLWDAAGRAHQFGEAGPEVLQPLPRALAGGAGPAPIIVNVYGDVHDSDRKFEQKVRAALAGAQQRRY